MLTFIALAAVALGAHLWVRAWHTPPDDRQHIVAHLRRRYPNNTD